MAKRLPLTDKGGEIRELEEADFRQAVPFTALPDDLQTLLKGRGPLKTPRKMPATIRFDADVLAALRATGPGWQTRVNEAMREWVKTHSRG